jgi:hypothetical protein
MVRLMWIITYIPSDWYWMIGGDQTQVFSSKRNALVPVSDASYQAWLSLGNTPTQIDTVASLHDVLAKAGVPPYAPVTPRQARLALNAAGLLDAVNAAVNAAGGATLITWEYATQIERNDPLISQIGSSLGLTDAQIDDLFIEAIKL